MGFDAGSIDGRLMLDLQDWDSGVKQSMRDTERIRQELQKTSEVLQSVGLGYAAVGAAIQAVTVLTIKQAMKAEETANLYSVSMGRMKKDTDEWAASLNKSVGIATVTLQENVGLLNNMLGSMGLVEEQAVDMSKRLVELGFDMASFYNTTTEEMFVKLRAGLAGETEPLKRLGVLVDEASVKMYAFANGIGEVGRDLTNSEKVLARYGTIMEQTGNAQGDMERTLKSLTNQLRIAQENVTEVSILWGNTYLPVAREVLIVLNDQMRTLRDLMEANASMTAGVAIGVDTFGKLSLGLGATALVASQLIKNFVMLGTSVVKFASVAGLIITSLSTIAGVIAKVAFESHKLREEQEKATEAFKETARLLVTDEMRYLQLIRVYKATGQESVELNKATRNLEESYAALGVEVTKASEAFGRLGPDILKSQLASLEAEAIKLEQTKANILSGRTVLELQKKLDYPISLKELQKHVDKRLPGILSRLSDLGERIENTKRLLEDYEKPLANIQDLIDDINVKKMRSLQEAFADAGIETTKALRETLNNLKTLREVAKGMGDTVALLQINEQIQELETQLKPVWERLIDWFRGFGTTASEAFAEGFAQLKEKIAEVIQGGGVKPIGLEDLIGTTEADLQERLATATAELQRLGETGITVGYDIERLKEIIKETTDELGRFTEEGGEGFMSGLQAGIEQLKNQWTDFHNVTKNSVVKIGQTITSGIGNALSSVIMKTKSASEAFREFGAALISTIIDTALQMALSFVASKLALVTFTGASVGAAATVAGAWTPAAALVSLATLGANAIPAIAGINATMAAAAVSAAATPVISGLGSAGGGAAGFATGIEDVPYTGYYKLHSGEKVVPRYDAMNAQDDAEGGSGRPINIQNLIVPESVAMAMSSEVGRDTILNIIDMDSIEHGRVRKVVRRG